MIQQMVFAAARRRAWAWMTIVGLAAYGVFIGWYFSPVPGGADSGGYFFSAGLINEWRLASELRTVAELGDQTISDYLPLGTVGVDGATVLKPSYPVGLPIHYAVA
ncbi:MAG: hypothetical protein ACREIA_22385, partial [Opitutaceae bacterium]